MFFHSPRKSCRTGDVRRFLRDTGHALCENLFCQAPGDAEAVRPAGSARGKKGYTDFAIEPLRAAFLRETPRLGFWLETSRLSPQETVGAILAHFS